MQVSTVAEDDRMAKRTKLIDLGEITLPAHLDLFDPGVLVGRADVTILPDSVECLRLLSASIFVGDRTLSVRSIDGKATDSFMYKSGEERAFKEPGILLSCIHDLLEPAGVDESCLARDGHPNVFLLLLGRDKISVSLHAHHEDGVRKEWCLGANYFSQDPWHAGARFFFPRAVMH